MNREEIKSQIITLLEGTHRNGIDRIINYLLASDYFEARCHSHHRFAGGLAQHSLEACRYALSNCEDLPRESVILGTLLHDLCTSHSPLTAGLRGHGRRSVAIAGQVCHFHLTQQEWEAIRHHMHRHAPEMTTNPLARLVFKADKVSAARRINL